MAMGSGLLALSMALVAADGPSCPPAETTNYHVRVLTLDGLDWRTSAYSRLQPVARQGSSTIWTADRALAASLVERCKMSSPCHTIMAVGEASMIKAEAVNYVAAMDRVADGPVNQSSAIAFMPRPEQVEERFAIRVEGRKLDQGILTKIALEETHVDVIHGVIQTETLVPSTRKGSKEKDANETDGQVQNVSTASPTPTPTSISSSVQIPEVTHAAVAGEWLIPNDGVLLISLGVKTAADAKGMAVVRERVAVIEACDAGAFGPDGKCRMISTGSTTQFQHAKLAPPVAPSRSLPEAFDPKGNLVDLPPLPESLASADLDRIKPEPNQPSPQTTIRSAPSADPSLARTSFDAGPTAPGFPASKSITFTLTEDQARLILSKQEIETLLKLPVGGEVNFNIGTKPVVGVEFDFDIKNGPKPKGTAEVLEEDFDIDLSIIFRALMKAGVKIPDDLKLEPKHFMEAIAEAEKSEAEAQAKENAKSKVLCDKCAADTVACQGNVTIKSAPVAGGITLYPVGLNQVGISSYGNTEAVVIPRGDNSSVEIKATVVPAMIEKAKAKPAATSAKKSEDAASRR